MMASQAYLQAASVAETSAAIVYIKNALNVYEPHALDVDFSDLKSVLRVGVNQSTALVADIVADEQRWISRGENPEIRFAAEYRDLLTLKRNDTARSPEQIRALAKAE